jgi:hypothetical protein
MKSVRLFVKEKIRGYIMRPMSTTIAGTMKRYGLKALPNLLTEVNSSAPPSAETDGLSPPILINVTSRMYVGTIKHRPGGGKTPPGRVWSLHHFFFFGCHRS